MAANNTIQRRAQETAAARTSEGPTMQQYIKQMQGEIKKALPAVMTPERFSRIVLSALSTNPKVAETTPQSFLGAMMTAAQLGVEPNTPLGQAYLIPFWNSKARALECQFQLGYKGLLDLAYRSGEVSTVMAQVVYENDEFEYSFGLEPKLVHRPAMENRGNPKYVYAMFRTKDGGYGYEVMSIADVRAHAQRYSKSFQNGPWQTNFEEMAKKTVLKRVLKYAPLKSEFMRAVTQDEVIKNDLSADMYEVPNVYVEADYDVDPATGEIVRGPEEPTKDGETKPPEDKGAEDGQQRMTV